MELKKIEKVYSGRFISYYHLLYDVNGINKKYEMVSRQQYIKNIEDLNNENPDAVVMIIHDLNDECILICKEYRMAIGKEVYNFPSGLIEKNETIEDCCKRELKEETNLTLEKIQVKLSNSYSAIGLCNEKSACVIGYASGEILNSTENTEQIQTKWYTKDMVRELLKNNDLTARLQMYCYMWVN